MKLRAPSTVKVDLKTVRPEFAVRHLIQLLNRNAVGEFGLALGAARSLHPTLAHICAAYQQRVAAEGRPDLRAADYAPYLRHRLFELLWELQPAPELDHPDDGRRVHFVLANLVAVLDQAAPARFYHELVRAAIRYGDVQPGVRDLMDQHDRVLLQYEGAVEYDAAVEQVVAHFRASTRDTLLGLLSQHDVAWVGGWRWLWTRRGGLRRPWRRSSLCWPTRARTRIWCADYRLLIGLVISLTLFIAKRIAVHYWNQIYYDCAQSKNTTSQPDLFADS